ncbi:MAG: DinB family protein [candidate division Zixibacteria bacterium]|nr:DinB family protein [candidate division Zixibacteria bacterium]
MTETKFTITPIPGLTPRVGAYLAQMEDVSEQTKKYVADLNPAQLAWYPNDKVESIGTLLLHIAAAERSWIGEDIMRKEMDEEEWKLAFPIRLGIAQVSGEELDYYLEIMDRTRKETFDCLRALTDDDLAREIAPLDPGDAANAGKRFTIEWILYHLIEHEAHHKGQIAVMKRLLPESLV